jgi:KDO2-lipid IV(A) lauroyltransferase
MSRKNPLLARLEYATYRLVARRARAASDAALLRWGARIGTITRVFAWRRTRLAIENFQVCFPERAAEARRVIHECWRHIGRAALATIKAQEMTLDEIAARCSFVGLEILHEALDAGKGVLIISAHFGNWEVAGLALMAEVRNLHTVARALDNELLERDLAAVRARTGAVVVERRRAARTLFKALADNGVVVLLPDQAVLPREGVLVPFLGRPAWTTDAPAKLAARLGSTIVIGFCIPDATGRHRLEFEESIRVDRLSESEKDPVALTRRINDVLSRRIAAQPELWLWMHDRWKGTAAAQRTIA